jgi:hypothetical protein
MSGKDQYRLAKLDFIAFLKWIRLVLVYRLPIDFGAIRAPLISECVIVIPQADY